MWNFNPPAQAQFLLAHPSAHGEIFSSLIIRFYSQLADVSRNFYVYKPAELCVKERGGTIERKKSDATCLLSAQAILFG
jgi:hypothetical protein